MSLTSRSFSDFFELVEETLHVLEEVRHGAFNEME